MNTKLTEECEHKNQSYNQVESSIQGTYAYNKCSDCGEELNPGLEKAELSIPLNQSR